MLASHSKSNSAQWQWENAFAGAVAGFATVAVMHPLDVVRTRFQGTDVSSERVHTKCALNLIEICLNSIGFCFAVNDGRVFNLPTYKNTPHAIFTIARSEVLFRITSYLRSVLLLFLLHLNLLFDTRIFTFPLLLFENHGYLVFPMANNASFFCKKNF